jgi:hypothetical protein
VPPTLWLPLAVALLLLGFICTTYYFMGTSSLVLKAKSDADDSTGERVYVKKQNFILELISGVAASGFLGFGVLFLALWAGIFV